MRVRANRGRIAVLVAVLIAGPWLLSTMWVGSPDPRDALAAPGATSGNVQQADADWALEGAWTLPPLDPVILDVALGDEGRMFTADAQSRAIRVYDATGLETTWPLSDPPVALQMEGGASSTRLMVLTDGDEGLRLRWLADDGSIARSELVPERGSVGEGRKALDLAVTSAGQPVVLRDDQLQWLAEGPGGNGLLLVRSEAHGLPSGAARITVFSNTVVALVHPASRRLMMRQGRDVLVDRPVANAVPLDVAAGGDVVHVLLRTASGPAVQTVDSTGAVVATRQLPDGVPDSIVTDYRWSLAVREGDVALTTGIDRLGVRRLSGDSVVVADDHGRVPEGLTLDDLTTRANLLSQSSALALVAEDPGVMVLDGAGARVLSMDRSGAVRGTTYVPYDAVDFTVADDEVFLSTKGDRVRRFPVGAPAASPLDPWTLICDCDLGGRLAAGDGVLHVTRPADREVARFETVTGRRISALQPPGAIGLWPADIAMGPDGRQYTADLVTGHVETWRDEFVESTWRAGLLAGPRRLDVRRLDSGVAVVAVLLVDGTVELHRAEDGQLLARWQPRRADGSAFAADDIALGADGSVYLAERAARRVRVFAPGTLATPTPGGAPTSTPTPSTKACLVEGDKVAAPRRLVLGETARVTMTLQADCPQQERILGADVALVLDRSSSMAGDPLRAAKDAARVFSELLDTRFHRLALVSYSTTPRLDVELTRDVVKVVQGIEALEAVGETDIGGAMRAAADHLQARRRADVLPVIVLLTDGRHTGPPPDPVTVADELKDEGIQIYTVGLGEGVDTTTLEAIASTQDRYFFAPTPAELFPIYREILRLVVTSGVVGNLIVDDRLAEDIAYVQDSADPRALVAPGRLQWSRSALPEGGLTLAYDVQPQRAGRLPVSELAEARYSDNDGVARSLVFPVPELEVIAPTPTPTPVYSAYLPIAYRLQCLPAFQRADIVLLVDTSSSMAGDKIEQARAASRIFISLLELPGDQAAVLSFDDQVNVLAGLTNDLQTLDAAVDALSIGVGTRIDRALLAARDALEDPRREPANRAVVVLLSDGGQSGAPDAVAPAAAELATTGAELFVIGLGPDADRALLEGLARPGGYYYAPDPADLADIYRRVAGQTVCR